MNLFRKHHVVLRRHFVLGLALIHSLAVPLPALAQVVPTGGKTNVYLAPNGVTVVNIETANAAGLSHNRYTEFNVDSRGLIFNNGNSSQMARDAALASQVMANLNLQAEASVILNEVVAANRSTLAGYMEVLGSRADVIIANPWGITCSGCGFINTPRATLTTGTANIGVDGSLTGVDAHRGDVLVSGAGLDGKTVDILDIVARSIRLDGQVNGKDLRLTAGANRYVYAGRSATAIAGEGAVPALAIDSSALGGMYANRIKLVATEAGVGVRMLGDAAATGDDMHLDAAGGISIQSRLSAERDVRITSTVAGADAIRLSGASLAGKRDLALSTTVGGVTMDSGTGNNLYAGNDLALAGNSGLALADARLLAGGDASLDSAAGGITVASGGDQRIQSTGGNITLSAAGTLDNAGYIAADAGSVHATLGGSLANSGTLFAKTGMVLAAATGLGNRGSIVADTGSLTARIGGSLTNSGSLYAKTALTLADNSGGATENIDNSGTVLSDGTLNIAATGIVNTGGIQGSQDTTVSAASLDNSGKLVGASQAGSTTTLTLGSLLNRAGGVIQATRDMTVNATTSLNNSGHLLSSRNLVLQGRDAGTTLAISNGNNAVIQAGETLTLRGAGGSGNATLDNQGGSLLADALAFNLGSLTNTGTIQGGNGASSLAVSGTLDNRTGATLTLSGAGGSASTTADTLINAGLLQSRGNATIQIGSQLTNSGSLLGSADLNLRGAADAAYGIDNSGTLQAAGLLSIKGYGDGKKVNMSIANAGVVLAGVLDMNAGTVSLADGARLSSVGNLTLLADTLSLAGSGAKILAATGGGDGVITLANAFINPGMLYSGGNLALSAPGINNTASGGIVALDTLTVSAASGDLYNAGAIYGGNQVNLNVAGTFTNQGYLDRGQGTVDSGGSLNITAGTVLNQSTINAAQNITIHAPVFRNEVAGGDTRAWVAGSNYASSSYTDSWYSFPDNYEREYHTNTWTDYQYYAGGKPTFKPQIIGGSSVTVQGFDSGANTGGVISGATVNFVGNGGGAAFVNDNLALIARDYVETYDYYTHYIAVGPAKYTDHQYGNYVRSLAGTRTIDSLGAVGLYATTLNAGGFALANNGAPYAAATTAPAHQAPPGGGTLGAEAGATGLAESLSFGGISIRLPTNPNGYFVPSREPNARYLVETNPLFGVGQNFVGSHYLEQRYGYNPDTVQKYLGDANYEGWLIRQQLVAQTGRNILVGYASEADQMRRLLDNAYAQSGSLGLTYGAAPTSGQLANLAQDMVWMVSQTVNGQEVLVPVVYLAQSTRDSLESGAVIAGSDVNLNLASLTNVGGTIAGKNSLGVVSQGDITNTSGQLKGGNVALASTAGSLINQTLEEGDRAHSTVLGKTAGIEASGNLALSAAKDVIVKGANVDAGRNAAIAAGGNVTFDTVEKVATDTTFKSDAVKASGLTLSSSSEVKRTTTARNVGSSLTTGGNLAISSGKDITLAGSKVKSGGDLDMNAQGDINIVARQDRITTHTESHQQGLGVAGGLWGSERVVKDEFEGINFAASTAAGGNARIKAGNTLKLEGSDLSVAGDADLNARDIQILAGKDEKRSHTETETLALISGATSKTGSSSGAQAGAQAQGREASASASAEASAEAEAQVKLFSARKEKTDTLDVVSRGSKLNIGGALKAKADNHIKLQGAEVATGGDLNLEGRNVDVLAAQDVHQRTTTAQEVSINLSSTNKAGAKAEASAEASGKKLSLNAEAGAKASASTDNVIGLAIQDEKRSDLAITHKGTVLKSGGNLDMKAREVLTLQAADITAAGDVSQQAKDIRSLAADDIRLSTSEVKTTTVGIYVAAEASAEAEAHARANVTSASVGASAEAKVEAGYGLHVGHEEEKTAKGSTTARVTTIKAGGNLTRQAENRIEDVGSRLEAGGDFAQSAREIDMRAARDTRFEATESDSHVARVGQFGSASAGASAQAGVGTTGAQAGANANAKAVAGFKAGYQNEMSRESSSASQAVVGQIKSGGKLTSVSSGETRMEGSQLAAGGDVELSASQLDYRAARNTQSSESETRNIDASVKFGGGVAASAGTEGVKVGPQVQGSLAFGYGSGKEASSASQVVAGGIVSGGKLKVATTQGDLRLESTNLAAAGDVALAAKGNLAMDAARDELSESRKNTNVGVSVSVEAGAGETSGEGSLNVGYQDDAKRSSQARAGSVKSGGNLSIAAGKDASFEGTHVEAAGDASVSAGGSATFKAARNTEESKRLDVNVGLSASGSKEKGKKGSGEGEVDFGFGYGQSNKVDSVAASIKSGGKTKVAAAGDVNLEGDVVSRNQIQAGGKVNAKALEKVDQSFDIGFSATIGVEKGGEEAPAKGKGAKETAKPTQDASAGKKKPVDTDTSTKPAAKKTDAAPEKGKDAKEATKPAQADDAGKKKSADSDESTKPAAKKTEVVPQASSSQTKKPVSMDEARTKGWRAEDGKWIWPSNDGFKGEPRNEALKVGATIDRFGSDKGTFFAPAGTPLADRAMAPDTVGKDLTLTKFEVLKPLPVAAGDIAPWFDQPGGGIQYKAAMSAEELVKQGYLKKIEVHQDVKVDELVKKGAIR